MPSSARRLLNKDRFGLARVRRVWVGGSEGLCAGARWWWGRAAVRCGRSNGLLVAPRAGLSGQRPGGVGVVQAEVSEAAQVDGGEA